MSKEIFALTKEKAKWKVGKPTNIIPYELNKLGVEIMKSCIAAENICSKMLADLLSARQIEASSISSAADAQRPWATSTELDMSCKMFVELSYSQLWWIDAIKEVFLAPTLDLFKVIVVLD